MHATFSLSIVVPAFNEESVLPEFHRRLALVLSDIAGCEAEIIYINDGSNDQTADIIESFRRSDSRVALVDLSRNFGKEVALTAGLDHARGDAIVVIDADLQDPPELIPELIAGWRDGYDVVYAQRTERQGETFAKKATARAFYRVIQRVSRVKIPQDTGDFRLMDRRAVDALLRLRESHRFMKGLFAWIGFRQKAVRYSRDASYAGVTKWNYWRLWNFAIDGITSFTTAPLKVATYIGAFVSVWAFAFAIWIVYKTIVYGEAVRGYPTLIVVVLLLGGVQLMALGLIGEYVGRMFDETKRRPLYLLSAYQPSALASRVTTGRLAAVESASPPRNDARALGR